MHHIDIFSLFIKTLVKGLVYGSIFKTIHGHGFLSVFLGSIFVIFFIWLILRLRNT